MDNDMTSEEELRSQQQADEQEQHAEDEQMNGDHKDGESDQIEIKMEDESQQENGFDNPMEEKLKECKENIANLEELHSSKLREAANLRRQVKSLQENLWELQEKVYENSSFPTDFNLRDELGLLKQKMRENQKTLETLEGEYEAIRKNFQQHGSNFEQSTKLMKFLEENDHLEKYIRGEGYIALPEQIQTYKFMAEELKYEIDRCLQIREDLKREQLAAKETRESYQNQIKDRKREGTKLQEELEYLRSGKNSY